MEGVGIAPVCALNVTRISVYVAVRSLGSQSKVVASESIVSPVRLSLVIAPSPEPSNSSH